MFPGLEELIYKAFGPKDHTKEGFRAILGLRVRVERCWFDLVVRLRAADAISSSGIRVFLDTRAGFL